MACDICGGQVVREMVKPGVDVARVDSHGGLSALQMVEMTVNDPSSSKQFSRRLKKVIKILKAADKVSSAHASKSATGECVNMSANVAMSFGVIMNLASITIKSTPFLSPRSQSTPSSSLSPSPQPSALSLPPTPPPA